METISVILNTKEVIKIDKGIFIDLLELSHIKEYKAYTEAIETGEISFKTLKNLAVKAVVPYPLFFASRQIIDIQIKDKEKNLSEKIPTKEEIRLNSRGRVEVKDIELIIKDLGRKQEFLKSRVLPNAEINGFIGSVAIHIKNNSPIENIATNIRNSIGIDLAYLRSINKDKVLQYLVSRIESKGILVSFSSYNYMPQNIDPELELSGICIKDKKFPFVFINTRDGDEKPKIIESSGRQIFTLLSMISCIAMGQFLLSSKSGKSKDDLTKLAYAIAAEIIIPKSELENFNQSNLEKLKEKAHFFRVTPSMLLYQLGKQKKIKAELANVFRQQLNDEAKSAEPKHRHPPHPATAYGKYNGARFSLEVLKAYSAGKISQVDVKNILFRQGKMDTKLFNEYSKKYRKSI